MRSTESNEQPIVPVSAPERRSTIVSGVCSECGTTYQVELDDGQETWMCPRCGPSTPIASRETPSERMASRPRRRLRLPAIRIPFFIVQLLIVSLTFVVFMGFLFNYLNQRFPPRRGAPRRPPVAKLPVAGEVPGATEAGVSATEGVDAAEGGDDGAAPEPDPSATRLAQSNSASGSDAEPPVEAPSADAASDLADKLALDVPQSASASAHGQHVSIREIVDHSERFFGQEVVLQCRLAKICDDALGKVPRRFDLEGKRIQLDEQEELGFVRLEIVDAQGDTLRCVFARTDGPLRPTLQWVMPGDWLRLTATPGLRYSDASASSDWGLVVIRVDAIDENSHDFTDTTPKQLAERR
jgi:hypothetical protein